VRRVLEETVTDVIAALVTAMETKDKYIYGRSLREAEYAVALANEMGLAERQVEEIQRGALIHDIGMIFVSPRIIRKPVELAEDEFEAIKKHVDLGAEVVSKVQLLEDVAKIVRHHHERYDGGGYPDGLADERIPLGARVVAVADAFEAMTEHRPYRKMLRLNDALAELERHAGSQFDPQVVKAFLRLVRRKTKQWPVPDDGNLLLAEVVIDGTLSLTPSRR
jgi:putative nucleotidyltransferase with HDIG domain